MRKLLTILISALALVLALLLVCVRSIDQADSDTLQDPTTHTTAAPQQTTAAPTQAETTLPPTTVPPTTVPPTTVPPTTEPKVQLTFSEDFTLLCRNYFVYDCADENLMAISCGLDDRVYPASITKLFTAYVALQYMDPETVIKIGDEVSLIQPGSSIAYVRKGHKLTVAQLVEGMLLPSGNDAAYALAAAVGRSESGESSLSAQAAVDHFVSLMNQHAEDLGMTGTHFANPDGYHHDDHYTTIADMIIIARMALSNELIRTCTATSSDFVTYASGHTNTWHNTNALIDPESEYYCPDAIGLKTGNTDEAGYCLLSAFQREGEYIIIGVFGCEGFNDRFVDSLKLYEAVKDALAE